MWEKAQLRLETIFRSECSLECPGDPMSDNKKGKAKSQNLPRRQRKGGQKKKQNKMFNANLGKRRNRVTTSVTAYNTMTTNPNVFTEGPVEHKKYGRGMRFVGRQMVTNLVTTASDSQLWTGTSPSATASINAIYLNPDVFNSRLALQAGIYSLYRFTAIDFEYEPLVATSQAGGAALCVSLDPDTATGKVQSYSQVQEVVPSVKFAFREPAKLSYRYTGDELFYNRAVSTTTADIRTSYQAVLIGYPSSSSIGAVTMGTLSMRYAVELYGQTTNEALVAFSRLPRQLQDKLLAYADSSAKAAKEDLLKVPLEKSSGITAPPNTPMGSSSSSSTLTSGSISSGWFRA